jgi:HD-GYP domain-containing protein (c-di-GMP phosphodiesterase class II)
MRATLEPVQERQTLSGYIPIYAHSLTADSVLNFDLYIFDGRNMILYRSSNLPLDSETQQDLIKKNLNRLYISASQRREYQGYLRAHIGRILSDGAVDEFTKSSIVYDSAKELVKDVFADPTKGRHIKESQAFVESTVLYVLSDHNAFFNLLKVMSFDYSVFTHSVNVCAFSLALAHAAGISKTKELIELATGALLHDVGKARVPESILFKPGPLDQAEWETMRRHPQWGMELLSETNLIPQPSYIPILQHHERQNGRGYPKGLEREDIHIYGKVVAIADAFDAMTTNRIYRTAESSFSTLKTMSDPEEGYDESLLKLFIQLMGPTRPDIA